MGRARRGASTNVRDVGRGNAQRPALRVLHQDVTTRDLRWLVWCGSGQPQERLPQEAELWVAAEVQALTAAMAWWGEAAWTNPGVAAAGAPAAQRTGWVGV